jgi:hypothetical protein
MALNNEIPETNLTDEDGISEEKAVMTVAVIEDKADDAPEWRHWRTSPNYTCFKTTDGEWLMQVGRNDPLVSIHAIETGYEATGVFSCEKGVAKAMANVGTRPKESLVDLWERRDEDWVIARKFDYDELSLEDVIGATLRQEAWGTQQATAEDNTGDA